LDGSTECLSIHNPQRINSPFNSSKEGTSRIIPNEQTTPTTILHHGGTERKVGDKYGDERREYAKQRQTDDDGKCVDNNKIASLFVCKRNG
jgi:hypothetical protein